MLVIDDEEDLLPELPHAGDGDDEPASDDELGLVPEVGEGDEHIGLDDAAGLDDEASGYALELPPEDSVTDEEGVDPIPVEGLDDGDEYGWTDDGRGEDHGGWDTSLDLPGLQPLARDDGGEEGVDDLIDIGGGDDVPHLRPLVPDEDDPEDPSFGDDLVLTRFDEAPARGFLALGPPACVVEVLGEREIVCFAPPRLGGGPDGLYRLEHEPVRQPGVEGAVRSIVAWPNGTVLVETEHGLVRTDDLERYADVPAEPRGLVGEGARVWGTTAGGGLFRSDDHGLSWSGPLLLKPVVALAAPASGGLVALCAGRDAPPQLVRTEDGGARWTATDGPPIAGRCHLAAMRAGVAVSSDAGVFFSRDRGKRWSPLSEVPAAGAIALTAEPSLTLYAVHPLDDRVIVARHRPDGGEPTALLELPAGTVVHAVHARAEREETDPARGARGRAHRGRAQLWVLSSAGVRHAIVDLDRAP